MKKIIPQVKYLQNGSMDANKVYYFIDWSGAFHTNELKKSKYYFNRDGFIEHRALKGFSLTAVKFTKKKFGMLKRNAIRIKKEFFSNIHDDPTKIDFHRNEMGFKQTNRRGVFKKLSDAENKEVVSLYENLISYTRSGSSIVTFGYNIEALLLRQRRYPKVAAKTFNSEYQTFKMFKRTFKAINMTNDSNVVIVIETSEFNHHILKNMNKFIHDKELKNIKKILFTKKTDKKDYPIIQNEITDFISSHQFNKVLNENMIINRKIKKHPAKIKKLDLANFACNIFEKKD